MTHVYFSWKQGIRVLWTHVYFSWKQGIRVLWTHVYFSWKQGIRVLWMHVYFNWKQGIHVLWTHVYFSWKQGIRVLMPLSAIFQLYHGDQFSWWKKPGYPERTTDHGQATGKLYHLWLRVECTLFCNLQSWAQTHPVLVICLYELLGNPTT